MRFVIRFLHVAALLLGASTMLALIATPASALIIGDPPTPGLGFPVPFNEGASAYSATSLEYQEVYAATEFCHPIEIHSLMFYSTQCCKPIAEPLFANGIFTLSLSTTSVGVGKLSTNLASNIGPDSTQVFIGSLPYATPPLANIISGQLFPYSIEFDLKKPFHFNPAIGNLLLDVVNNSTISGDIDGVYNGTAFSSAVTTNNPGAPGGAPELGLTTGFNETSPDGFINYVAVPTITPLPAALPLFATGLGALGLLGWLRKQKAVIA